MEQNKLIHYEYFTPKDQDKIAKYFLDKVNLPTDDKHLKKFNNLAKEYGISYVKYHNENLGPSNESKGLILEIISIIRKYPPK